MFFTKDIEIWRTGDNKNLGAGLVVSGGLERVHQLKVDVQPYMKGRSYYDYGLDIDASHVIFAPVIDVKPGKDVVLYRDEEYNVIHAIEWDEYVEIFIDRRK